MNLISIVVVTVIAVVAAAVVLELVHVVTGDGYRARIAPPRSHPADEFEPRSRLA